MEDYPGWYVRYAAGQWTAWCPAVIVHANTAVALRAAIEAAISPDPADETDGPLQPFSHRDRGELPVSAAVLR